MRKLLAAACLLSLLLTALPVEAQVGFARSAAIGAGTVFIGEPGNRVTSGYVYVYTAKGATWVESAALVASDATNGDGFGTALLADDNQLLVSAATAEGGAVYVFEKQGRSWVEVSKIVPDTAAPRFGTSIASAGNLLLVGASAVDDNWGAAYVFEREGSSWNQVGRLEGDRIVPSPSADSDNAAADDAEASDEAPEPTPERFGSAVALHGEWALVGAPGTNQRAGLVYAFKRGDMGWELETTLGDGEEAEASFGSALATRGEELYVTVAGGSGAVSVHTVDETGTWTAGSRLVPFDGGAIAGFGSAIAFDGHDVLISAPSGNGFIGVIYRFGRLADGTWTGVTKISGAGLSRGASFGGSLALVGDTMVAGLTGDDFGAGTAMIMTRTLGGWDRTKVASAVKSFAAMTGSLVECTTGAVGEFPCQGVDLLAYLPIHEIGGDRGVRANDIWGWTDPESERDYAIIGLSNATTFVDVTDPYRPVYVGKLPMTDGARPSVWRDIKVYADHAFIVSDSAGEHGMQVFDLARLREFNGVAAVFDEDAYYDNINSAHNVVINEESAFAFIVGASGGGETCGGGLHMVNIEDPKRPVFAGCFQDARTGRSGTGYSHDAQCVTYTGPDERYDGREICFGSNETALSVADVTDKRNPQAIGMASYPNVAYSHQGWLTEDHRYFYMNDEGDEGRGLVEGTRTIIWDVQDLEDPIVVGEYIADNKAVDHNLYVVGNIMYQSNYDSGLRVFDVSDPENIAPIGFLDTVPFGIDGSGGGGSWSNYPYFKNGVVVVTSMSEGFFVAKLRADANPNNE